jgi:hypothetical protein
MTEAFVVLRGERQLGTLSITRRNVSPGVQQIGSSNRSTRRNIDREG